jgi:hypothetical protein
MDVQIEQGACCGNHASGSMAKAGMRTHSYTIRDSNAFTEVQEKLSPYASTTCEKNCPLASATPIQILLGRFAGMGRGKIELTARPRCGLESLRDSIQPEGK